MGGALKKLNKSVVKAVSNPFSWNAKTFIEDPLSLGRRTKPQATQATVAKVVDPQNGPTGDGTSAMPPSVTNPQVDEAFMRALDDAKKRRGRGTTSAQGALELLFGNAYGNAVAL
jgi:hypothetical protein